MDRDLGSPSRYLDMLGASLPVDERVVLSKLSPNEVQAWADARVEEYQRRIKEIESHIATFHSLRNTQSPINVLPPELLGRLLTEGYSAARKDIRIAQVCRHWHAVAMSTPQFFANALESSAIFGSSLHNIGTDFLPIALQRSGPLPLRLQVNNNFQGAWPLLATHASRLHSLTVKVESNDQVTALGKALSSNTLHALQILQIESYGGLGRWKRLSLEDAGSCLPRLRKLHIDGTLLTYTFIVSTLEELTVLGKMQETLSDFARGLKRCPGLKGLTLSRSIPNLMANDFQGLRTVTLSHLQEFVLQDSPEQIHNILAYLPLPSTASISIHMDSYRGGGDTLHTAVPRNYMQRFYVKPLIDRLYLTPDLWDGPSSACCYAGAQERLRIATKLSSSEYSQRGFLGFLEVLFEACQHSPLTTLTVDTSSDHAPSSFPDDESCYSDDESCYPSWDLLFKWLPHLRRLELTNRTPIDRKMHFATTFLNTCGSQESQRGSSGLTLAWVVLLDENGIEGGVLSELGHLAWMLESCRRCARLELYGVKTSDVTFRSLAEIPTDPTRLRTIAAPILPQLSGLVDVLTIH